MSRTVRFGIVALAAVLLAMPSAGFAQRSYATGQTIAPAYEGWERNDDGSFDLVFGYMNRNWEEVIDVPVGPGNSIEPGGPDQGQPTRLYPRRNRFVFRIRVPADFGDQELIWTLTTNGQTERAYASLRRDYYIDGLVIQANYGAGGAAATTPELAENEAPTVEIEGSGELATRVGEPVTLVAVSTDDGKPSARSMPPSSPRLPGRITTDTATGHRFSWFVYRGAARRHVRSASDQGVGGHARHRRVSLVTRLADPGAAGGRPLDQRGDFRRAGHLRAARPRARRRPRDDRPSHRHRHSMTLVGTP